MQVTIINLIMMYEYDDINYSYYFVNDLLKGGLVMSTYDYKTINNTATSTPLSTVKSTAEAAVTTQPKEANAVEKGEVIKGQVVDLRGKDIKIQLDNSQIISAKVKTNVPLSIGDKATFLVEKLSPNKISLKVIDNNRSLSQEALIDKALEEIQIPKSERTIRIVRELINNQLAINKTMVQNLLKEAATYKNASISTLVIMNKYNIERNDINTTQFEAYRNYEHRLISGISSLADSLMQSLTTATPKAAMDFHNILVNLIPENPEANLANSANGQVTSPTLINGLKQGAIATLQQEAITGNIMNHPLGQLDTMKNVVPGQFITSVEMVDNTKLQNSTVLNNEPDSATIEYSLNKMTDSKHSLNLVHVLNHSQEHGQVNGTMITSLNSEYPSTALGHILSEPMRLELINELSKYSLLSESKESILSGNLPVKEFLNQMSIALSHMDSTNLTKLLNSEPYQTLLKETLINNWTISPKTLKDNNAIRNLYEKLETGLEELTSLIAKAPEEESLNTFQNSNKLLHNLKDNIDFMKTLNELFTYVQLPMKLSKQNAHSELFVYTNKKAASNPTDHVSVLLHLDMEHLGPLDIHLDLAKNHVVSKIYTEDTTSQGLFEMHIGALNTALNEKGYTLSYEILKREKPIDIVKDFMQKDIPNTDMKRYSFDIRA